MPTIKSCVECTALQALNKFCHFQKWSRFWQSLLKSTEFVWMVKFIQTRKVICQEKKFSANYFKKRNNYMTELRWQNEYDRMTTTTNVNNWIWPKLKPTNLKLRSGVLPTVPLDVFFSCRGVKRGWAGVPASASLQARAGEPVQYDRTSILFWG